MTTLIYALDTGSALSRVRSAWYLLHAESESEVCPMPVRYLCVSSLTLQVRSRGAAHPHTPDAGVGFCTGTQLRTPQAVVLEVEVECVYTWA
jgi:hypothetical protein